MDRSTKDNVAEMPPALLLDIIQWDVRDFDRVESPTHGLLADPGRTERQYDLLARIDTFICSLTPRNRHHIVYGYAMATKGTKSTGYISPDE